ncbi:MAG: S49 family peptidase, partial [Candidatus Dependentiae bacterium]|nr:S49 family peptidase [Candidatus Dependentiae bacterium]
MKFFDYLKNIFIILLIIHFAPMVFESIRKQYSKLLVPSTKVGVLTIKGILYDASYYNNQLTTFFKDNSIKAVLLKIECPGGAAGSSQALFNEIQALKKQYPKPVITLVENVCTSGGYYIACSSDSIIATGAATIGSIGCYLPLFQLKEFIEQFKIGYTPIKTGAYKTITDPLSSKTPEEKALLQELSADIYQQFVEDVAAQRKLSINTVNS